MPFPTRLLLEGESVHVDLRPHWWFFVGPVAAGVPVLALIVGVSQIANDDWQRVGWWGVLAVVGAWGMWLSARLARWSTTHFVVTSDRIVYRTGVLSKHGRDVPLERVNDITSNRTLFERIIGAGDLLVSARERGQQTFSDIPHPDDVQQEIYRQIEANAARALSAGVPFVPGGPAPASVPDQIAALAALRDRGALSDAEFQAKKSELLERM